MTRAILEPARSVDVVHETEVLVVGSGPGGLAAALASARAGAQTALLERYGCFGGNITQVGVEGFAWYRHPATIDSGKSASAPLQPLPRCRYPASTRGFLFKPTGPFLSRGLAPFYTALYKYRSRYLSQHWLPMQNYPVEVCYP